MSPYFDFSVTPAPQPSESTAWDLDWHDGPTSIGWNYGPADGIGAVPAEEAA